MSADAIIRGPNYVCRRFARPKCVQFCFCIEWWSSAATCASVTSVTSVTCATWHAIYMLYLSLRAGYILRVIRVVIIISVHYRGCYEVLPSIHNIGCDNYHQCRPSGLNNIFYLVLCVDYTVCLFIRARFCDPVNFFISLYKDDEE